MKVFEQAEPLAHYDFEMSVKQPTMAVFLLVIILTYFQWVSSFSRPSI